MLALFFNSDWVSSAALERTFERISKALDRPVPQGDLPARFKAALKELEGSVLEIEDRTVSFSNPGVQDFLQRVVAEDRLLPSVIRVVEEFAEFQQSWAVWCAQKSTSAAMETMAAAWAAAASRLLYAADGNPLQRLALMINLYDRLKTDELAILVDHAINDLSQQEIEGDEADEARSVLEQLTLSLLPMEILDKAKEVVTAAVASMLRDYGFGLSLDTIKSVTESLFEHGSDENSAAEASTTALKGYLDDLDSVLSDITSVGDLETFEQELTTLMDDYGVTDTMVASSINHRRDELLEYESRYDDEDRGWSPADSPGYMSDDDIRSLFGALREV